MSNKRLSRLEFDVLTAIYEGSDCDFSCDAQKDVAKRFAQEGLIDDKGITALGLEALEPYKVQRAVIMAAGFGSRLVPITINTPKPLVRVNGTRIIDTVIDATIKAGIEEIIIIRGYLGEQFDQLLYKYPNLKFIENSMYNKANNISSMVCARSLLKNAYVMEADLYLSNFGLIKKYQYCSNFLGIETDYSDDWCFFVKDGIIRTQVTNGNESKKDLRAGEKLYQEVGISYWSYEDGIKLEQHLIDVYERPDGKNRYWDQVPFVDFGNEYKVDIRPCEKTDIVEIDSYKELVMIDGRYAVKN